jgi:hypothetical protein
MKFFQAVQEAKNLRYYLTNGIIEVMNVTFDLPEELSAKLKAYLESHPQESLADLIEDALAMRPLPKRPEALLSLTGIVAEASFHAADHAEDRQL